MQIKAIRIITGDELVANVVQENPDGSVVVRDALLMVMNMQPPTKENPQGNMVCNFYPWSIINEGDIKITAAGIIACYPVPKEVEASYTQNTSNIMIADGATAKSILHG